MNISYHEKMSKSSTKNKKHINVRYYFIKDQVETGGVVIEHNMTEEMLWGHFTNPFQGALFSKFRAEIMNIPDDLNMGKMGIDETDFKKLVMWKLHNEIDPGCPKECVGDCDKVGRKNCAK